ncbi:hypothetical protein [Roseibium alexandrii]|uniref:Uncharacterized protein n=1 Tax=Roseibium alexandrii TaxID=388408 RepID=A0A0M7ANE8_9HYPH|nr:hypothetical protein [Roseibium alexandrii]CTQ75936.1 hypothetical protein LAX5112_04415 [Roseibium alexandrii]
MSDTQDRRPKFRADISLGNILTMLGMIGVGATAWIEVRTTQAEIQAEIKALQNQFERRIVDLERSELERRADRLNQVTLVTEIRADIKYLREAFSRIETDRNSR